MKRNPFFRAAGLLAVVTSSLPFFAEATVTTIDLTTSISPAASGPYGSIFARYSIGSGTGIFNPFLKLNGDGNDDVIDGYSTSAGPSSPASSNPNTQFIDNANTHALTYGDLRYVTVGGIDYARFILDINEPTGGSKELLVLNSLKIFAPTSGAGTSSTFSGSIADLGAPIFDLGDTRVLMNYSLASGSGTSDIEALIPLSVFLNGGVTSTNSRIVFYSQFGDTTGLPSPAGYKEDGNFEEWRFDTGNPFVPPPPPPPPVPEITTSAFAGALVAGLAVVEFRKRRKKAMTA